MVRARRCGGERRRISKSNFIGLKKESVSDDGRFAARTSSFSFSQNPPQFVAKACPFARCPKITEGNDLATAYTGRKDCMHKLSQIAYGKAIKRGNKS